MTKVKAAGNYKIDMCTGPILPKMLRFALPLMASSLLQLLFNAADIIVVGQFCGDIYTAACRFKRRAYQPFNQLLYRSFSGN